MKLIPWHVSPPWMRSKNPEPEERNTPVSAHRCQSSIGVPRYSALFRANPRSSVTFTRDIRWSPVISENLSFTGEIRWSPVNFLGSLGKSGDPRWIFRVHRWAETGVFLVYPCTPVPLSTKIIYEETWDPLIPGHRWLLAMTSADPPGHRWL